MKKTLFIFFVLLTLSVHNKVNASENKPIPNDAVEFNSHFYKLFDSGCTQKQAIKICENLGGHLLTISSDEEQMFIDSIIENCTMKNIWLGGVYENNEWCWITNEAFIYSNWNDGEPNNASNSQNAIMMYTYQGIDNDNNVIEIGRWNDENEDGREWDGYTSEETGFICEWEYLSSDNSIDTHNSQSINNNEEQDVNTISSPSSSTEENQIENSNNQLDDIEEYENNNNGINITVHIDNISLIGGISIFGGISFIGIIIKNKKKKKK